MTTPMIVGNQYAICSTAKRVSRHMRMLIDLCLTLVDVAQKDGEITDRLFMCCVMQTLR